MSSVLGDIAELVPQLGRAAVTAVQGASNEVARLVRPDKLRPIWSDLRYGPIIPVPYRPGQDLATDGFLALCAYQGYTSYTSHGIQPVTLGLVGLQALLHFNPSGYRLLEVGLNARRVVQFGEAYRLVSSPVLHANLPHLATNLAGFIAEGSELERRIGSSAMLGTIAAIGALSQSIYIAGCWGATKLSSAASVVVPYYHGYAIGSSAVVFGLQALVGYLREAERGPYVDEEFPYTHGRYRCWLSLGVTHWLVPGASLAGHVSGIAAGLLTIYVPQAWTQLWRRATGRRPPMQLQAGVLQRHRTRWWKDLLGHLVVGGGTVAIILLRRRQQSGGAAAW
ncbi:hypothetical protein N2152v2_006487 [Parachlorella kessleri]